MLAPKREKKVNRTILAITDFTKSSTNAVLFAANLFKYTNLKIILLNVFETPNEKEPLLISVEDILTKDSESGLKKQSSDIALKLKEQGVSISTFSISGKLKKALTQVMETESIDLILSGISTDIYPSKYFSNTPILFIGQSKYPVLLVPEKASDKELKSLITVNFDASKHEIPRDREFEHMVNHDHIVKHVLSVNEKKIDKKIISSLQTMLSKEKAELVILIPAPGDKIDKALLDYRLQELCPTIASLLNC